MLLRTRVLACVPAVLIAPCVCGGAVVFIAASREVSASSDGALQSFSSSALGAFNQTATSAGPTFNSSASQGSSIDPAALTVVFGGSARTNLDGPLSGAAAFSHLTLIFTVDSPTPYAGSSYFMPGFPTPQNLPQAVLRDAVTDAFVRNLLATASSPVPFDGVLAPGSYRLVLDVPHPNPSGTTTGGSQSISFDMAFIPAPGSGPLAGLFGAAVLASRQRRDAIGARASR